MHVKKNDLVKIISGKNKGVVGKVLRLDKGAKRVVVEGVDNNKRHLKPERSRKNPEGGVIEIPRSVHVSNVMLIAEGGERPFRSGVSEKEGKKLRVAVGRNAPELTF